MQTVRGLDETQLTVWLAQSSTAGTLATMENSREEELRSTRGGSRLGRLHACRNHRIGFTPRRSVSAWSDYYALDIAVNLVMACSWILWRSCHVARFPEEVFGK